MWTSTAALALALEEAGRGEEALSAYKRARDMGEALFRANPEDPNIGHELARNLGNMGIACPTPVELTEALAAFVRAQEVLKAAASANPTLVRLPAASAWVDYHGAQALVALGRNEEALAALGRAREAREILIKANPAVTRNREQLIRVLRQTADIHRRAGRMAEVLAALKRAQEIAASLVELPPGERRIQAGSRRGLHGPRRRFTPRWAIPRRHWRPSTRRLLIRRKMVEADPSTASHRSSLVHTFRRRGLAMQKCGRPADAVRDFRQSIIVLQELTGPSPWDYYNTACFQSLIVGVAADAGSGLTSAEGRVLAEEAMSNLHRAVAAGFLDADLMRTDPDLDPIRSRPDFQALFRDVAFPTDPFAPPR